ncbi:hypothetical protein [Xenorhabdus innexi]|uniref:Uncharacterized protein n=1 Tax=Xenorhabdus innexi TaxID=290109 RepID=A0A1N6MWF3_9GAMM|nr:hypothetical protein [Xenorhabdus innexi]PHM35900.1 hypothetical protein Xinn_01970 [Xenorhabdus innexi]SIP73198.1 hypothetical protein XIS1_1790004 [Xenorhabdus innexi]
MSVVLYDAQENCLYADSICVDNYHRMTVQKVFTYHLDRTNDDERGLAGFVGDPSIGYALIHAYRCGGMNFCEQTRTELLTHFRDSEEGDTGNILIIPEKQPYMWVTSGLSAPFFPVPKQRIVIGDPQITSRVYSNLDHGMLPKEAIEDACCVSKKFDAVHLVSEPVIHISISSPNTEMLINLNDVVR